MNSQRINPWLAWIALLVIVVGLPLFAWLLLRREPVAGGPATQVEGSTGWPRTLVERFPDGSEGRRLVLQAPPQRIVSVTLATDEILLDIIDRERIVALSDLAPRAGSLVADRVDGIRNFVSGDVESIIALQPDLCFLASFNREETRSLLVDSGIPVHVFRCFHSMEDIRNNIRTVGRAVGAEREAEGLVAEMDRKISSVVQRIPSRDEWPTALVYSESGWVAGTGTPQTEVFEAAGLRNAAAEIGIAGFAQVSEEQVLEMDPDYLVVVERSIEGADQREWLVENPALAPLKALREQRLLTIEDALLSSVSHHIADAVVRLAQQVYPDRFADEQQ